MKEVGLDVLRLEGGSPAHLTYFSRDDVAHQALLTAISISVGIDDGHDHPERLFYVPMAASSCMSSSRHIASSLELSESKFRGSIRFHVYLDKPGDVPRPSTSGQVVMVGEES